MASTTTILPTASTTEPMSGSIPIKTVIIITASLGAAMILLVIILLCLCVRRNRARRDINSSVKSVSDTPPPLPRPNVRPHDNSAFTITDETTSSTERLHTSTESPQAVVQRPQVSPRSPRTVVTQGSTDSTYIDMSGGVTQLPQPDIGQTIDINQLVKAPDQPDQGKSVDYLNATGEHYVNVQDAPPKPPPMGHNDLVPPELPARRTSTESIHSTASENNLFRRGTKAYHLYSNAVQDYEMSRDDLQIKEKLGKGHFGSVYAGKAAKLPHSTKENQQVAIKTMRGSATDSDKQEFLYEYEIMKLTNTLKHKNITKLLGSVTKSQPCMIVLELMSNGNLRTFLRQTRSQEVYYNLHGNSSCLAERQLLQFAVDIANGMEGISDLQLLHRDLAARNILLDENLTCKIADFGFAKDVLNKAQYKSKSVFQRPRPTRWLAPESLFLFNHSILSDVWSYGIVLWEIITLGNLPYPNMKTAIQVSNAISQGYRMPCPRHCSPDIYRVMTCCWEEKPNKRPAFPQLVDKMKQLLDKATYMLDMGKLEDNNDYIEILPPDDQEVHLNYESKETLA